MKPSVIVWDLETVPDLGGFAAANDLVGKSDVEVREAIGEKFPKHIYHSIICIGALIVHREPDYWTVSSARLKHCDQLCQIKDFEGVSGYSNQSETNHNAPATATKGPIAKMPLSPPCSK